MTDSDRQAPVAELVDATDSKSVSREAVRVRVSLGAHVVLEHILLYRGVAQPG